LGKAVAVLEDPGRRGGPPLIDDSFEIRTDLKLQGKQIEKVLLPVTYTIFPYELIQIVKK